MAPALRSQCSFKKKKNGLALPKCFFREVTKDAEEAEGGGGGGEERDNLKKAHIEIQQKEEKTPTRHSCVCLGVLARRAPIHAAALVAGLNAPTYTLASE